MSQLTFNSEDLKDKFLDLGPIMYENPNGGVVTGKITVLPLTALNCFSFDTGTGRLSLDLTNAPKD